MAVSQKTLMRPISISISFFIIGLIFGVRYASQVSKLAPLSLVKEVRMGGFKFINPLLECEYNNLAGQQEFGVLEEELRSFIDTEKAAGKVKDVSVYFRDLNNGPWIGIGANDDFAPASLLKLPVMMAYFKKAELQPGLLTKKVRYKGEQNVLFQHVNPTDVWREGQSYTVEELIERMITKSDNIALRMLEDNISNDLIDKITLDLGIATPNTSTPEDFMSVKEYASLYRILFNAAYLSPSYSEKALSILSKVEFNDGIPKGVDGGVVVAHKFGERGLNNNIQQFHDCGIVYFPSQPYLLCIMTRGNDTDELISTIGTISRKVYVEMKRRNS